MEEPFQQDKQESEYKDPNEDQDTWCDDISDTDGGIRRRLRDRELLRKRKAEAEEKETNQWVLGVESPRKRQAGDSSRAKKRGRPRKTQPTPEVSATQEESAALSQETPAIVVVSEPAEIIPFFTLPAVESQPASALDAPLPMFGSVQSPVFAPTLTPLVLAPSTQALESPSVPAPAEDPIPIQDLSPAPALDVVSVSTLSKAPLPAAPPAADPVLPTDLSQTGDAKELQDREDCNQVVIEDLGPDDEEDISPSQDKSVDEDLSETPSINVPEQNKMFSVPTLSSPPPPQKYLPGNSL